MTTTINEFRKGNKDRKKMRINEDSHSWLQQDETRTLDRGLKASVGTDMEMDSESESIQMKVALRNFESYGKDLGLTSDMLGSGGKNLSLPEVHNTDRPTTFGMRHGSTGDIKPDSISHMTLRTEKQKLLVPNLNSNLKPAKINDMRQTRNRFNLTNALTKKEPGATFL